MAEELIQVILADLRKALRKLDEGNYELVKQTVIDSIKKENAFRAMKQTMEFAPGDKVQFEAGKYRDVWTGTVQSVNRTTITVEATSKPLFGEPETKGWRVAPSYLRKVE